MSVFLKEVHGENPLTLTARLAVYFVGVSSALISCSLSSFLFLSVLLYCSPPIEAIDPFGSERHSLGINVKRVALYHFHTVLQLHLKCKKIALSILTNMQLSLVGTLSTFRINCYQTLDIDLKVLPRDIVNSVFTWQVLYH